MSDDLNQELLMAYTAMRNAMASGELDQLLDLGLPSERVLMGMEVEEARKMFAEHSTDMLWLYPEPAEIECRETKTEGDRAALYYTRKPPEEPGCLEVGVLRFEKIEDRWITAGEDYAHSFETEEHEDVEAYVRELLAGEKFGIVAPPGGE